MTASATACHMGPKPTAYIGRLAASGCYPSDFPCFRSLGHSGVLVTGGFGKPLDRVDRALSTATLLKPLSCYCRAFGGAATGVPGSQMHRVADSASRWGVLAEQGADAVVTCAQFHGLGFSLARMALILRPW